MKILIVNKFLYPNGGSETYIFGLGRQLEAMGHEVQYFGMEHPDRCVGNAVGAYTTNMDFHAGEQSLLNKLSMPFRIIYSREARRKIRQVLDDFKPDVVHLNNINFQITPSIIYEIRKWDREKAGNSADKEKSESCRIIFTAHDYQWICPNHMLYIPPHDGVKGEICDRCKGGHFIECTRHNCIHGSKARSLIGTIEGYYYKWRKTYALVDKIICPSRFLYDRFAEDTILKDKLVMLHNFIEYSDSDASSDIDTEVGQEANTLAQIDNTGDRSYVLYFGRFAEEKGIRTLMAAVRQLTDIPFIIAGSGSLEEEVKELAGERNNVEYVGFKTGEELKRLISEAEFSVYPSEWYENCPFSVMESISLGTPVLGADIGGIPELILPNDHDSDDTESLGEHYSGYGMMFSFGDVSDLTDKISKLWTDRDHLKKLKGNCKNNRFDSLEEYGKKYVDVIKS